MSHTSLKKAYLSEVADELTSYGVHGFVAHAEIEPTLEWQREIEKALASCQAMAAFLHAGFHESKWTDQELGYAIGRRLLVIPIRFDLDPYGFIGRYQGLPGSDSPSAMAKSVFELLLSHELTRSEMGTAIVATLENATSFADAKRKILYAKGYNRWTSELLRRLEEIPSRNSQVGNATGVPKAIAEIIAEHSGIEA